MLTLNVAGCSTLDGATATLVNNEPQNFSWIGTLSATVPECQCSDVINNVVLSCYPGDAGISVFINLNDATCPDPADIAGSAIPLSCASPENPSASFNLVLQGSDVETHNGGCYCDLGTASIVITVTG
ncbi:hypothetical protein GC163_24260 [bacterium]|nr:hypothetical protein [bacterium]